MASKTTNYGLNKHSPQDFYNVEARNENWDKIDEALAATDPTKITTKVEPTDGDGVMIADSADGGKAKRLLWSSVKTALGKLFVPLARKVNGKTLTEDVTLTGENIAVSTADSTPISGAVKYRTNPNLLDNWYFGRPVNQRGQMKYTESWKYGIDRWLCAGDGKVTIANDHCVFYGAVDQGLSVQMSDILGCTMTASLLLTDGTLITGTAVNTDNSIDIPIVSNVGGMYLSLNATDLSGHRRFRTYIAPERAVLAAKLELGDTQTLAHKNGGIWVLNEIPDFGEQLRRCQRYCRPLPHKLDVCLDSNIYFAYTEESFEEMRSIPICLTNLVGKNVLSMTESVCASITNVYTFNMFGGVAIALSQNPNTDIVFLDSKLYLISADL